MDFQNGNGSSLINLSSGQQKYVDETNSLFDKLGSSLESVYGETNDPFSWFAKIFNLGGVRDMRLQDFNRKLDIMLQNTAIRRRVADALQSGVNPVFALNSSGAGSDNVATQPSSKKNDVLNSLLKMLIGITFLLK